MLNDKGMPSTRPVRGCTKTGILRGGQCLAARKKNREPRYGALATIRCENTLAKYVCRKTG